MIILTPTPDDIRAAREKAGLATREAAALVWRPTDQWSRWERGGRKVEKTTWALFLLRAGLAELGELP